MSVASDARVHTAPNATVARGAGLLGSGAGLLWAALTVWEYRAGLQRGPLAGARLVNQLGFTAATVGYVVMLIGLHRTRPAGDGKLARTLTAVFVSAWLAILAGQLLGLLAGITDDTNPLLPIGGILQAVASLAVGVAIARAGRWTDWRRWSPLALGVYYLAVLFIPAFAGHEPGPITEPIWALTYAVLGVAVASQPRMQHTHND